MEVGLVMAVAPQETAHFNRPEKSPDGILEERDQSGDGRGGMAFDPLFYHWMRWCGQTYAHRYKTGKPYVNP